MCAVFSDAAQVQAMLDVEAALARAEAGQGVIPASAVADIGACCIATQIDFDALANDATGAGNLAIPLVKQLTAAVARVNPEAAKFVHWGATSQDIIDSGMMLQLKSALPFLRADLHLLAEALAALARQYKTTPMIGRTWMQHALPVSFGLKAAGWLDAVLRHQDRLDALPDTLCLQFGGAAGTLASLGGQGLAVAESLAHELQLAMPDVPWHAQRDQIAAFASTLGLLVGSLGKMARDISLMTQTEVAEVAEPAAAGRGGSSTMPHKRNPVGCAVALSAAVRVPQLVATIHAGMVQEHERALGGWQAEWEALPQIVLLCAGSLAQMRAVAAGLSVDTARMRANLNATRGQIMAEAVTLALGARLGRLEAHHLVEQACRRVNETGLHLREILADEPQISALLSTSELDALLDPANYTGQSTAFVERVLTRHGQRNTTN
jgi:3-carboxy-cis,cis-muconate cycloisomerase